MAIGFSTRTGLPARMAASAVGANKWCGVAISTASTLLDATSSPTELYTPICFPTSAVRRAARSFTSHQAVWGRSLYAEVRKYLRGELGFQACQLGCRQVNSLVDCQPHATGMGESEVFLRRGIRARPAAVSCTPVVRFAAPVHPVTRAARWPLQASCSQCSSSHKSVEPEQRPPRSVQSSRMRPSSHDKSQAYHALMSWPE